MTTTINLLLRDSGEHDITENTEIKIQHGTITQIDPVLTNLVLDSGSNVAFGEILASKDETQLPFWPEHMPVDDASSIGPQVVKGNL